MNHAPYLQGFDYWIGDVHLHCWLEYEPADKSTGQRASTYLAHAYVGESSMDVAELLAEPVINKIEHEATYYLSKGSH